MQHKMKTCPVCLELYDQTKSPHQDYVDVCPACNEAFCAPEPPPAPKPPPPESPQQRKKRLTAKARELLVLEFCHQVLSERIKTDSSRAHYWQLKDKVATHMSACLRDTLPVEFRNPLPALSCGEREDILKGHPLLYLGVERPPDRTGTDKQLEQIRAKVRNYLNVREIEKTEEQS